MDRALHIPSSTFVTIEKIVNDDVIDHEKINGRSKDYVKVLGEMAELSRRHRKSISTKEFKEGTEVIIQCIEYHRHGNYVTSREKPYFPSNPWSDQVYYGIWTKPWLTLYITQTVPFLHDNR